MTESMAFIGSDLYLYFARHDKKVLGVYNHNNYFSTTLKEASIYKRMIKG